MTVYGGFSSEAFIAQTEANGLSAEPPYILTDADMDILMQDITQYC